MRLQCQDRLQDRARVGKNLKGVVRSVTAFLRHGACDQIHEVRDEERCFDPVRRDHCFEAEAGEGRG